MNDTSNLEVNGVRYDLMDSEARNLILQNTKEIQDAVDQIDGVNTRVDGIETDLDKVSARTAVSVLDYGADPTGAADSTTAVQAAVDAAHAATQDVFFPGGTYKITAPLKYYSNMTIYGIGATLKWAGASGVASAMMWISSDQTSGSYNGCHDVQFRGLKFDGGGMIVTLVCFSHGKRYSCIDCEFYNISNWHFIEFNSCQWSTAVRCDFHGHSLKAQTGEMVQFDAATSSTNAPNCLPYDNTVADYCSLVNCVFHNEEYFTQGDATGVAAFGSHSNLNNCSHVSVSGCFFAQMFAGARFRRITALKITDNYFQNVKCAMVFNNLTAWTSGEVVRYAIVTGNIIAGYQDGVAIDFYPTGGSFGSLASDHCTIAANQISNASICIRVLNNTTMVSNNNLFGTNGITTAGGAYYGAGNAVNGVWQAS